MPLKINYHLFLDMHIETLITSSLIVFISHKNSTKTP